MEVIHHALVEVMLHTLVDMVLHTSVEVVVTLNHHQETVEEVEVVVKGTSSTTAVAF